MKKIQLIYLLVLIYAITSKKYSRDNLRKSIDKHNFGKTQEINIPTQSITKGISHGIFQTGNAFNYIMKGKKQIKKKNKKFEAKGSHGGGHSGGGFGGGGGGSF